MLRTTLIKLAKYLLALVNMVSENKDSYNKGKSIKKNRNKIIEILARLKY